MCAPLWCETNADKGSIGLALRKLGLPVRCYHEHANKRAKISSWLLRWWPRVTLIEGTDPDWLNQILDYTDYAAHDDAPDSAASLLRVLDRHGAAII